MTVATATEMATENRAQVVARLHLAQKKRRQASEFYTDSLYLAREYGLSNTDIARACGVSEAAIRLWFKRHLKGGYQ